MRGVGSCFEADSAMEFRYEFRRGVVEVWRPQRTTIHISGLPAVLTQVSTNKSSLILDLVPLTLGQLRVFLSSLTGANRRFEPITDFFKGKSLVRPRFGMA